MHPRQMNKNWKKENTEEKIKNTGWKQWVKKTV